MRTPLRGCGCIPWVNTGGAVFHSAHCRSNPNVKLTKKQAEAWRAANLAAKRSQERGDREMLMQSVLQHPAKGDRQAIRSVNDPAYVDAHIDDADDDGGGF